jgi:hypothetical protein
VSVLFVAAFLAECFFTLLGVEVVVLALDLGAAELAGGLACAKVIRGSAATANVIASKFLFIGFDSPAGFSIARSQSHSAPEPPEDR